MIRKKRDENSAEKVFVSPAENFTLQANFNKQTRLNSETLP